MSDDQDKQGRDRLLEALGIQADPGSCQNCLDQLDGYVTAQLAGQPYANLYPQVALHLDACPDCAGAYARLYELELAVASQSLPQAQIPPMPELSIQQTSGQLAEQLRAAIQHVGSKLTFQFSAELLELLGPRPILAPLRGPEDDDRYGEKMLVLEPHENWKSELPMSLVAYRDAQQPEKCLVEVIVQPPGQSWPDLGGTVVMLRLPGQQFQAITDNWGMAAFSSIPIDQLAEMAISIG